MFIFFYIKNDYKTIFNKFKLAVLNFLSYLILYFIFKTKIFDLYLYDLFSKKKSKKTQIKFLDFLKIITILYIRENKNILFKYYYSLFL